MSRYTFILSKPVLADLGKAREKVAGQVGASRLSWDSFLAIAVKRLADKPPRIAWKWVNGSAKECPIGVSQATKDALDAIKSRESKRLGKKMTWDSFMAFVARVS